MNSTPKEVTVRKSEKLLALLHECELAREHLFNADIEDDLTTVKVELMKAKLNIAFVRRNIDDELINCDTDYQDKFAEMFNRLIGDVKYFEELLADPVNGHDKVFRNTSMSKRVATR